MAVATQSQSKKNFLVRFFTMDTSGGRGTGRKLPLWRQLVLQVLCLLLLLEVMFPLMYVITMSLSSKTERPYHLETHPERVFPGCLQAGAESTYCKSSHFPRTSAEQYTAFLRRGRFGPPDRGHRSLCILTLQLQDAPGTYGPGFHPAPYASRRSVCATIPTIKQCQVLKLRGQRDGTNPLYKLCRRSNR